MNNETNSKQPLNQSGLERADLISSLLLILFSLFILINGLYIALIAQTGSKVWYYSPGMFPIFIGSVLLLLSVCLLVKNLKSSKAKTVSGNVRSQPKQNSSALIRLFLAIGLLAAYVFVLIGHIPFVVATFLYLSVTMFCFRKDQYPIWKILIISICSSAAIYFFFGVIAAVPLP